MPGQTLVPVPIFFTPGISSHFQCIVQRKHRTPAPMIPIIATVPVRSGTINYGTTTVC
jgi:hypothetical protein